jgi:hypothetical protein
MGHQHPEPLFLAHVQVHDVELTAEVDGRLPEHPAIARDERMMVDGLIAALDQGLEDRGLRGGGLKTADDDQFAEVWSFRGPFLRSSPGTFRIPIVSTRPLSARAFS